MEDAMLGCGEPEVWSLVRLWGHVRGAGVPTLSVCAVSSRRRRDLRLREGHFSIPSSRSLGFRTWIDIFNARAASCAAKNHHWRVRRVA